MPSPGALAGSSATLSGAMGQGLYSQAQGIQSALTPFFQNEMYNPQGFGPTTLSEIMTQEGQGTAGALGAARQTAINLGARTGNLAAIPQLTAAANKAGSTQMSNLGGQLAIAQANERLAQQQSGVSGLSGIMGQDIQASLGEQNIQQEAIRNQLQAQSMGFGHMLESGIAGGIGKAVGAAGEAFGYPLGAGLASAMGNALLPNYTG